MLEDCSTQSGLVIANECILLESFNATIFSLRMLVASMLLGNVYEVIVGDYKTNASSLRCSLYAMMWNGVKEGMGLGPIDTDLTQAVGFHLGDERLLWHWKIVCTCKL